MTSRKCKEWSEPSVSEQRCVDTYTRLEVMFHLCYQHFDQVHHGVWDRGLALVT